jgi:hypothetical protein
VETLAFFYASPDHPYALSLLLLSILLINLSFI